MFKWFKWFRKNLRPGKCECSHERSCHIDGVGECNAQYPPDEETNYWTMCACVIYIRAKDDGDDDGVPSPDPKEVSKVLNSLK